MAEVASATTVHQIVRHRVVYRWLAAGMLVVAALLVLASVSAKPAPHFANADDKTSVKAGRRLYVERCSGCHGRYLQGQPLWQMVDKDLGKRAPALGVTGPAWNHSDEDLFVMVRSGHFPGSARKTSFMPPFAGTLSDAQILSVVAYIKASWPVGLRVMQAGLNPGHGGIRNPEDDNWTFPAIFMCRTRNSG